ncbi:MAG: c-type cytochrome [Labilithrix sp.]
MRLSRAALTTLPLLLSVACAGRQTTPSAAETAAPSGNCSASSDAPHPLRPLGLPRTSSGIALAEQDGRTLALIADEDDKALHVLDVAARRELASVPVQGAPSHVLVASDGRVLVTLRDVGLVQVLTPTDRGNGALAGRCTVPTSAEPIAIAESPDKFVVTAGWGHAMDVFARRELGAATHIDLPREPRGVHVSADGKSAVVAHLLGSTMSVVNLETGVARQIDTRGPAEIRTINVRKPPASANASMNAPKTAKTTTPSGLKPRPARSFGGFETTTREATIRRHSIQGGSLLQIAFQPGRGTGLIGPRVLVDPGEPDEMATYYGAGDRPPEVADVLILDDQLTPVANEAKEVKASPFGRRVRTSQETDEGCGLPAGMAENTADHTALLACLGSDTLLEYAIETASGVPRAVVRGRWPVAKGPTAVAYDAKGKQAVVWSQYDHAVSFVALPTGSLDERVVPQDERVTRLSLARPAFVEKGGEIELGRALYHATGDHRISREGLACASCHPDGRDDGLTWATLEGPRNAPMLAGRLDGTAPFAWAGSSERVSEHLEHTVRRLGGQGLGKREMEALAAYCLHMKTYSSRTPDAAKVARGKEVFNAAETKCASCHTPQNNLFTDKSKHDVGTHTLTDSEGSFDTPSLRFVGGTAPYFHDGRYKSLHDLLVAKDNTMGSTSQLSATDVDALEAYLKTL